MTPPASAAVAVPDVDRDTQADRTVADLTRQMARGQEQAFHEFHTRYFDRLFGHLLVLTRGQEDQAREALQETMVRIVRYVRPFHEEEVFWCWLTALARSAVRDQGRRLSRYRRALQNYALRSLCLLAPSFADEQDSRLHSLLERSLDELNSEDRALLQARYYARSSIKELSRIYPPILPEDDIIRYVGDALGLLVSPPDDSRLPFVFRIWILEISN